MVLNKLKALWHDASLQTMKHKYRKLGTSMNYVVFNEKIPALIASVHPSIALCDLSPWRLIEPQLVAFCSLTL